MKGETSPRIPYNESELLDASNHDTLPENAPTTVLDGPIMRCKFATHIGIDGKSSLQKPVEKCATCGARKVCGPFVGHVCLRCQPDNARECTMCHRQLYDCTC
jgi:hypothetical protein